MGFQISEERIMKTKKELALYVKERIQKIEQWDTEFGEHYWVIRELKAMQENFDLEVK